MRGQLFAPLLRDLGQAGVQPLQVLKLVQQLGGAFGSMPATPGTFELLIPASPQ